MNKVTVEISKETYDFLRELCTKMNNKEDDIFYPSYCVDTTKIVYVPPFEGDEREYWHEGKRVLGKDVYKYCTDKGISFEEFLATAQHTCDLKAEEDFVGFFLTEDACEAYIDDNIDSLREPYTYKKSIGDNPEMLKVIRSLFELTGVKPAFHWLSEDERNNPVFKIEENIREFAKKNGYDLNEKAVKGIAKAKNMMFGLDNWQKCPCASTDGLERFCGSEVCAQEIEKNGICHCSLNKKRIDNPKD